MCECSKSAGVRSLFEGGAATRVGLTAVFRLHIHKRQLYSVFCLLHAKLSAAERSFSPGLLFTVERITALSC